MKTRTEVHGARIPRGTSIPCADCGKRVELPGRYQLAVSGSFEHYDSEAEAEAKLMASPDGGVLTDLLSAWHRENTRCKGCGFGHYLKGKDPNILID